MTPFNLEAAKRGEPVCTREGILAEYIGCAKEERLRPLVFLIVGAPYVVTLEGKHNFSADAPYDLFMAPRMKKCHVQVFRDIRNGELHARIIPADLFISNVHDMIYENIFEYQDKPLTLRPNDSPPPPPPPRLEPSRITAYQDNRLPG